MDAQQVQEVVAKEPLPIKTMKLPLYLFIFLFATSLVAQKTIDDIIKKYNDDSVPYITSEMLATHQNDPSIVLLDTREQFEYNVSHIEGAIYAGHETFEVSNILETIKDTNTHIVVYCSLGVRSEEIGKKLQKAGYTNIQNLYGGIFDWKNKDYPVVNNLNKETESVHVYSKEWGKWLLKGKKVY